MVEREDHSGPLRIFTQGGFDRIRTILTQHAAFAQRSPGAQDSCLDARRRSIPCPTGFVVGKIHARQVQASGMFNPVTDRAHAHPQTPCNTAQRFAFSDRLNHRKTALFSSAFLDMNGLHKITKIYTRCSANAETQVFS